MMKLNIQMFASTNKTANYDLPQFVGTDKPTWLGDFNTAMSAIDAGMAENKSDIESMDSRVSSAEASASQASENVATLTGKVNTLQSNVETATTTANNAQSTATTALNTANTANGKGDTNATNINSLKTRVTNAEHSINKINLVNISTPTLSRSGGSFTIASGSSITVATNSDGTLAKIYGQVTATNVQTEGNIICQSSLRPKSDITINGHGAKLFYVDGTAGTKNVRAFGQTSITIKTNGQIVLPISWSYSMGETVRAILNDSLLYIKDFGDVPKD